MKSTGAIFLCFSMAFSPALCAQVVSESSTQSSEIAVTKAPHIYTPAAGIERTEDVGVRMHPHFKIFVPAGRPEGMMGFTEDEFRPDDLQPISGYVGETPASLACVYGIVAKTDGCNPNVVTKNSTGGALAVAIVDAYDYPTAAEDLKAFALQFGLPAPVTSGPNANFTVAYQTSIKPKADPGCANGNGLSCWAAEAALDIEMVHAMAPRAHIFLVEANSDSNANMYAAVARAAQLVQGAGGGEVTMSWGSSEFVKEAADNAVFFAGGVVFLASTGDSSGVQFPSSSPDVVAVGGTTISRNQTTWIYQDELVWESTGGGQSAYEARPAYQNRIIAVVGSKRGVPDVAAVANPNTPVWVYDNYETGGAPWEQFGGTSVAVQVWGGIVNQAGSFSINSMAELSDIYAHAAANSGFRDITSGACGNYDSYLAVKGWDFCAGVGSPVGSIGK